MHLASAEQVQCELGECIYSQFVCDGEPDCSNGLDETNCLKYTSLYMVSHDFNQLINQNISTDFYNRNSTKYFNKISSLVNCQQLVLSLTLKKETDCL